MERLAHYETAIAESENGKPRWLEISKRLERVNLEAVLRRKNWKKLHGASFNSANWISADNHNLPLSGFLSEEEAARPFKPAGQPSSPIDMEALSRAVEAAVAKALARAKLTIPEEE